MKTGYFIIIKDPRNLLFVDKIIFDLATDGKIDPILWCRNGEYRVIPKEIIQNVIDLHKTFTQQKFKVTIPVITIMWSQGIPISNQAGRALIGE